MVDARGGNRTERTAPQDDRGSGYHLLLLLVRWHGFELNQGEKNLNLVIDSFRHYRSRSILLLLMLFLMGCVLTSG